MSMLNVNNVVLRLPKLDLLLCGTCSLLNQALYESVT